MHSASRPAPLPLPQTLLGLSEQTARDRQAVLGSKQQKQEQAVLRQEQLKAQFLQKQVGGRRRQLQPGACSPAAWPEVRRAPWLAAR
jgi:hypothetical protein